MRYLLCFLSVVYITVCVYSQQLKMTHTYYSEKCVIGELSIDNQIICEFLEKPYNRASSLKSGTYKCTIKSTPNMGWRIQLINGLNVMLVKGELLKGPSIIIGKKINKDLCMAENSNESYDLVVKAFEKSNIIDGTKITLIVENSKEIEGEDYFVDSRDNKRYPMVKIGDQLWMTQNISYKADGSVCYENDEKNCEVYGRLYTWEVSQNVCPVTWHLPSDEEWQKFIDFFVPKNSQKLEDYSALKVVDTRFWNLDDKFWNNNNKSEANSAKFNAIPGGQYYYISDDEKLSGFGDLGKSGCWWSSTLGASKDLAVYIQIDFNDVNSQIFFPISNNTAEIGSKLSVRCIKD